MMNPRHDQIWPYLHGELSEEERMEFVEALKNDEVLQQALEERQATHALLNEAAKETDNEALVDVLLDKWESEHPEFSEKPSYSRTKIIKLGIPLATAAAAAFVLISAPWRPIHWEKTVYGENPLFRNGLKADFIYSRSDLKRTSKLIRRTIESELTRQGLLDAKWSFKLHLQEVNEGMVLVEISGHPEDDADAPLIWKRDFQSLEILQENIPQLATEIADDIAP